MVVFVVRHIYNKISDKNRVKVVFYNSRESYSLDVSKIESILYDGRAYYIVYRTKNEEFYKQKFGKDVVDKAYGVPAKFEVKSGLLCPKCGNLTEIDDWAMYTDENLTWCSVCNKYVNPYRGKALFVETPNVSAKEIAKQVVGFDIERVPAAHGVEKYKVLERVELPSRIVIEIVKGMLVKYDMHAWLDGINAVEKELGPIKAVRVVIPKGDFRHEYFFIIE